MRILLSQNSMEFNLKFKYADFTSNMPQRYEKTGLFVSELKHKAFYSR